jgi:hypothetical protein
MSNRKGPAWASFLRLFQETARYRHRYEVFRDFVTMAAFCLHNRFNPVERLEAEYLAIVGRYEREDVERFPKLFDELVTILDVEPWDALGQLYMELGIQSEHVGQFFTPPALSELMARMSYGEVLNKLNEPFVTVQDPACGAGGMILAFTKVLIESGHNPSQKLWVQCQDIDRTAALMCYVQLALWNIPGVVIVGNTLTLETHEVFYTPAHYLGQWDERLATRRMIDGMRKLLSLPANRPDETPAEHAPVAVPVVEASATTIDLIPKQAAGATGASQQFDFGF